MPVTRRTFLAAVPASYFLTAGAASAARVIGANEKLNFAGIGVGGKGQSDITHAGDHGDVVALVDVDSSKRGLGWSSEKWKEAKTFTDYRKLFDDSALLKNIDACVVSTADHHHATASVLAMKAGKHVYCQKPLTHSVFEARVMKKVAAEMKVCTQMGNQGSALPGLRRGVELIQGGIIGPVSEIHVWTDRPREYWKQAPDVTARPPEKEIPKTLDWDCFIGPAPMRPYNPAYTPFLWRGWWDFGTGAVGDMACHTANMAFRAAKLGHPTLIKAESGEVNPETAPAWAKIVMDFPARGDGYPAVKLHWYEGKKDGAKVTPPKDLLDKVMKPNQKLAGSGSLLVGEKGILFSPNDYGAEFTITPGDLAQGVNMKKPEKLPAYEGDNDKNNKKEWVAAIKAGKPEMCYGAFDYSSLLTEAFLLGNVAVRSGKEIAWDGPNMKITNHPDAMQYVKHEFRKGWDLLANM